MGETLKATPGAQVSLTDPEARAMSSHGKGTDVVGYNVQIAVDTEHHLILAHEVTNIGSDRASPLVILAKAGIHPQHLRPPWIPAFAGMT